MRQMLSKNQNLGLPISSANGKDDPYAARGLTMRLGDGEAE